jgi:hypothetical protein
MFKSSMWEFLKLTIYAKFVRSKEPEKYVHISFPSTKFSSQVIMRNILPIVIVVQGGEQTLGLFTSL